MCGITGIAAKPGGRTDAVPLLLDALGRLAYRGYDSTGIALANKDGIRRARAKGKLAQLRAVLEKRPILGAVGIGHTRWATHGPATEKNAHPHLASGASPSVALVHNGIIENYRDIKTMLAKKGVLFESDTDTEVVAHLVSQSLQEGAAPREALLHILPLLEGAYAFAFLFDAEPDALYAAAQGSPLCVGFAPDMVSLASDGLALAPTTERIAYLEDGDCAKITHESVEIWDEDGRTQTRAPTHIKQMQTVAKGNYRHFTEKEICEQPDTMAHALGVYLDSEKNTARIPELDKDSIGSLLFLGCGAASYAGAVARHWCEAVARIPAAYEIASEFRYREPVLKKGTLPVLISQSGETADTLAALAYCQDAGLRTAALVNVDTSRMARRADIVWPLHAGPEIGVASTKAFTAQLGVLAALVIALAGKEGAQWIPSLLSLPGHIARILRMRSAIETLAREELAQAQTVLFLGRGALYPIAREGALKCKELPYIHAEPYPAGELKHGPIALIEEGSIVVVLAPSDALFDKTRSSMEEVKARGGRIILLTDAAGAEKTKDTAAQHIIMPETNIFTAPILYTVPVQLLGYYAAVALGTDADQPRNLAKSVTVE